MEWQEIEALWRERHNPRQLAALQAALEQMPATEDKSSYPLLWRRARLAHFQAMQASDDEAAARRAYDEGAYHALHAWRLQPAEVEGHFWYGVNLIEGTRRHNWLNGMRAIGDATSHIERSVNLDEEYYFGAPLRVSGRLMHQRPLLMGGNVERALDIYRRALQVAPTNSTTLLYYAEALIADKQPASARKLLQQIVEAKEDPEWRWEQNRDRQAARALIVSLQPKR